MTFRFHKFFEGFMKAAKIFSWTIYYLSQVWVCSNSSRSPCKHLKKKQKDRFIAKLTAILSRPQRCHPFGQRHGMIHGAGQKDCSSEDENDSDLKGSVLSRYFILGRYGNTHTLFKVRVFFPLLPSYIRMIISKRFEKNF